MGAGRKGKERRGKKIHVIRWIISPKDACFTVGKLRPKDRELAQGHVTSQWKS